MRIDNEKIRHLPKGDVHNHLTLSVSRKRLKKNYQNSAIIFPDRYNGLEGMTDFIHKEINAVMRTGDDVIRFMELAVEDCIEDNVIFLEASVDMKLVKYFANDISNLTDSVSKIKTKYRKQIDFRPEIGINKNIDVGFAYKNAIECMASGEYSGIDLYGPEKDMDLSGFVDLFQIARTNGIKTKLHIGEFSNYQTIIEAIDLLNPSEIQHGINAAFSEEAMKRILEREIRLNVCPQSNITLGAVRSMNEHPIRILYDYGIKITINTDDLLLFDATVSDQYISLIENNVFSFEEIEEIRKNSLAN